MNKDSNILAEKYEVINEGKMMRKGFGPRKDYKPVYKKLDPFGNPEAPEETPADKSFSFGDVIDVDAKEPGIGDKAKKAALAGIRQAGRLYGGYKVGKDYFDKRSKAASDAKNTSRLYATEFLKGEQSYQDLNNRYGIDDAQMYDLLKKARIPVTAFGMYRGKAGRGVDVYNDYINKYKPAPMQKLGRGIKSFANYFKGKKKPEA